MEFEKIMRTRYAAKRYKNKQISEEHLQKLLTAVRLSPSSYNGQPWKVVVIADDKLKKQLLPASFDQPQITECSHLFVFCGHPNPKERFREVGDLMREDGVSEERVKGFLDMTLGAMDHRSEKDRIEWAKRHCFIPLMALMAQATDLGLNGSPMEGFIPKKYQEILGIDAHPVVLCAVGYPADKPEEKLRFPEEKVFDMRL